MGGVTVALSCSNFKTFGRETRSWPGVELVRGDEVGPNMMAHNYSSVPQPRPPASASAPLHLQIVPFNGSAKVHIAQLVTPLLLLAAGGVDAAATTTTIVTSTLSKA